ncbi:MAG: hypothetical protein JWR49_2820, partial [Tardiphaga sp.]|nr:hypothetical protein [Tardiphaga sp.]
MANNTKKAKDPTEVALSAIQEALNISDAPPVERDQPTIRHDNAPSSVAYDENSFDTRINAERPTFEQAD